MAVERHCKSIAFCCISTGVFGFPQEEAASPSTRCGAGSTPTPRPICTSFSTSTPRKTSKPTARFSANRDKPVVGGQKEECAREFGPRKDALFADLGKRRF
ncbi:macro domain-containing protein [Ellagibacter isourolithinifaciens]|uniref:macro domain-containing protein n=1 Tax=Ellagibacter isourolithinifaciens TaxID=2137581 RepID=UPI003A8D4FD8